MSNHSAETSQRSPMVSLSGAPEQIGTTWGELNREAIAGDMEAAYLARATEAGVSRETLIARSAAYVRIAEQIGPHWLAEARAVARSAGVDEELYVAFIDGEARSRFLHGPDEECTSYAVSRSHARDGAILFHKTRDNVDRPQVATIVDSSLEGIHKFIGVTDIGRLQCSMMVNDQGLAGSGDYPANRNEDSSTLQLPPAEPKYRGVMMMTILRHIAERASNCAAALGIIEDFVGKGFYAGGDPSGSHWLFVDREGAILEVCNNARHVVYEFHTQDVYFSKFRDSRAARRLRESPEPVDFGLFHGVSRDPSICFDSSISGMTVEIAPDHPETLTCAWVALPVRAVAMPLFVGQTSTPACVANGAAYQLGKTTTGQVSRWEAMERSMHAEKQQLTANGLSAGAMEQWSAAQAARLMEVMRQRE